MNRIKYLSPKLLVFSLECAGMIALSFSGGIGDQYGRQDGTSFEGVIIDNEINPWE